MRAIKEGGGNEKSEIQSAMQKTESNSPPHGWTAMGVMAQKSNPRHWRCDQDYDGERLIHARECHTGAFCACICIVRYHSLPNDNERCVFILQKQRIVVQSFIVEQKYGIFWEKKFRNFLCRYWQLNRIVLYLCLYEGGVTLENSWKNRERVATFIPVDLYEWLKNEADKSGTKMSAYIRQSLIKARQEQESAVQKEWHLQKRNPAQC